MFVSDVTVGEDRVRGLRERLAAVAAQDRSGWAPAALSELVVELAEVVERAEAVLLRVVGEWDAVGAWELEGAASPASWLAAWIPRTRPAAVGLVRDARLVRRHERTAQALAAGEITVSHVETMSRAARVAAGQFRSG